MNFFGFGGLCAGKIFMYGGDEAQDDQKFFYRFNLGTRKWRKVTENQENFMEC